MAIIVDLRSLSLAPVDLGDSPSSAERSAKLQRAAGVVDLNGPIADGRLGDKPELRPPHSVSTRQDTGEHPDVRQAMAFIETLKVLADMLLNLQLGDSDQIRKSSARELDLAKSQGQSMIDAGNAALVGGISKAAVTALTAFTATAFSWKGINKPTRPNTSDELGHDPMNSHGSKWQTIGNAVHQLGVVLGMTIDASQSNASGLYGANREFAAGGAAVQSRQTDVDIKKRGHDEENQAQILSNINTIGKADSDLMSQVAQNTRI